MNPNIPQWKDWGSRGIKFCDRWDDFTLFLEDMGACPSDEHSLDRIDNNGNYEPENCRWATAKEQRNNARPRSDSVWITHNGMTMCMNDWCKKLGLSAGLLSYRVKAGMTPAEILAPAKTHHKAAAKRRERAPGGEFVKSIV